MELTRKEEFEKVKELIEENFVYADDGIFDTTNIFGDRTYTLYEGKYFTLEICYDNSYFEVHGANPFEFKRLLKYYYDLEDEMYGTDYDS